MDTNCENCKFWGLDGKIPATGYCRRYAPRPEVIPPIEEIGSRDTVWPRTKDSEWCGEWETQVVVKE